MPFINTKTNIEITTEKQNAIKTKLGKAIELIPGKSENWLMLSFDDKCSMYFKGQNDKPMVFVEVKLFGSASESAYDKLTAAITKILEDELDAPANQIYVKYEEVSHWGWNGNNF
jgi:phenylpyruvate tautomerase PptA (4-oxalocrotonate tautomerase family)